ncbi:Plakophilin-4 like [Actinidia chinensis var. chinensis]|uniref:Plakophilin-4 like n=1 Tax=Actinidia chinensis var. chinensis TaxID=1590841 RepID=A0A2R6QVV7_ACTCC|nr:Plakophilin-4 like [Actinidia chinensis var. chinensis]
MQVLLQVNVGVDSVRDPILEIFQFEKYQDRNLTNETHDSLICANPDPCGELLKWLLPLDNSIAPPSRPLSPPTLSSNSSIRSTSTKSNFSASSGSQLFSFGHFRSYSMSSLPPNIPVTIPSSRPNSDLDDWDQFSSQKFVNSKKPGSEGLLSFRGVSLEPDRFSVRCGLEGIYIPGRRWRRKIEIIQPIEIHSFAADCNTDDLLCVQIKNVSPSHTPDIVVYLDAITIVFEEVSKGGPAISLPIACIEAGNSHSLPNLALRRGEEHSFILKPVASMWKTTKSRGEKSYQSSHSDAGSSMFVPTNLSEGKLNTSTADQYAVLVSCRCNYTESKLFFKQPTSWRPRISRDLLISVASEMSRQNPSPNGRVPQLPVQVLTLQASNLTSEDLTLTVLAPASFTSPPSVVSLNSSPTSPMSPFIGHSESAGRMTGERRSSAMQRLSSASLALEDRRQNGDNGPRSISFNEQAIPISNVLPSTDLGCTHLWLQSRVPLGCVPSQSTATIKLELLPLTDGIITLDSLQIDVKEKGMTYIPEHSLKINATSSIATGIV